MNIRGRPRKASRAPVGLLRRGSVVLVVTALLSFTAAMQGVGHMYEIKAEFQKAADGAVRALMQQIASGGRGEEFFGSSNNPKEYTAQLACWRSSGDWAANGRWLLMERSNQRLAAADAGRCEET